eukprot:12807595-Alexandrium_andersonii.AAC.1
MVNVDPLDSMAARRFFADAQTLHRISPRLCAISSAQLLHHTWDPNDQQPTATTNQSEVPSAKCL